MKCSEARAFLSQISGREQRIAQLPSTDLDFLSTSGYVLRTTKDDHDLGVSEVARLSQLLAKLSDERKEKEQAEAALRQDQSKEHSFRFQLEGKQEKDQLRGRVQAEETTLSKEQAELESLEANVNSLIQEKSMVDRMVPYDGGYLSLTGLGSVILNDLSVRNYRVSDQEFPDFLTEIKSTYDELRTIASRGSFFVNLLQPKIPDAEDDTAMHWKKISLLWGTAIGLAKLQGDPQQIGRSVTEAMDFLKDLDSTIPNTLMAAEVLTATGTQDIRGFEGTLKAVDGQLRKQGVPKELSAGVAATIMAGRRFDGSYPTDTFAKFRSLTSSYEAASILAVMNVPFDQSSAKFNEYRSRFDSWGYMKSEDTEVSSAFLAIGELNPDEVEEKLKYIIEQLRNYLEYPLVAAAILASIPVFEAHEALDLMEKAVTLLSAYVAGLERSEVVALAVRMIHGVRNELVKEIDPTAKTADTPVQFTYPSHPGVLVWYRPVIVAHAYYHSTFSGMGGFHPAHSHGVGGFAG